MLRLSLADPATIFLRKARPKWAKILVVSSRDKWQSSSMDNKTEHLSAAESAELVGVALATINEFYKMGFLKAVCFKEGAPLFSLEQVSQIFGSPRCKKNHPEFEDRKKAEDGCAASKVLPNFAESDEPQAVVSDELPLAQEFLMSEITSLREERDWLRARIEKLELGAERNQLLLLSRTGLFKNLLPNKQSPDDPGRRFFSFKFPRKFFSFQQPRKKLC